MHKNVPSVSVLFSSNKNISKHSRSSSMPVFNEIIKERASVTDSEKSDNTSKKNVIVRNVSMQDIEMKTLKAMKNEKQLKATVKATKQEKKNNIHNSVLSTFGNIPQNADKKVVKKTSNMNKSIMSSSKSKSSIDNCIIMVNLI